MKKIKECDVTGPSMAEFIPGRFLPAILTFLVFLWLLFNFILLTLGSFSHSLGLLSLLATMVTFEILWVWWQ